MGFKITAIKDSLAALRKATGQKYVGAMKPTFRFPAKNGDLLNLSYKAAANKVNKAEILTKYCADRNLVLEDVMKEFDRAGMYLDNASKEQLLTLAQKGEIALYTPATKGKKVFGDVFLRNRNAADGLQLRKPKGVLNYISGTEAEAKEAAEGLKELLMLQKEGKLNPENITQLLKMYPESYGKECREFLSMLKKGEVTNENINQALLMVENGIPLEIFNPKNLAKYSKDDLREFALVLQASREKLPMELLHNITKEAAKLTKVNVVSKTVSREFLDKFEQNMKVFAENKHSIDDLVKAGGIKLSYSRESLKENILSKIKDLPFSEQKAILNKFGLAQESEGIMSGFPVLMEQGAKLTPLETSVNNEIRKFLNENKIMLPTGFEEYQGALDGICKTFPEFMFTIGAKQHKTHTKHLAEHMLMALEENMKNPLYKTLNPSDRRVLGISTLLHDLNKIERTVDPIHPLTSSQSVNAIVQRMEGLTTTEKNRIINFVENHHWLMKVKDLESVNPEVVSDLAFKFRHGNDFAMAKIFAESDLKAVNSGFFPAYGGKIQSKTVQEVEQRIHQIQANGKMVFTADVTLDKAINAGAKELTLGEGKNATKNWVVGAKELGLDKENVIYHAGDEAGLICAAGNCGYGRELVLSASLGKQGQMGTYGNCPQFIGFRQMDMNNIGSAFKRNTKFGKDYNKMKLYLAKESSFVQKVKEQYLITDEQYAKVFNEVSSRNLKLTEIHSDKRIQRILGGEKQAKEFEAAVKNVNKELESTAEGFKEVVIMDPELGFIGTKNGAQAIGYDLRKFAQDNKVLIVEF